MPEIRSYINICNYVIDETGKCIGEMALLILAFLPVIDELNIAIANRQFNGR
jgi:hypothetical protein